VLFTAFSVVLGTLVVQGLTLRPLMNALQLRDEGEVEREFRLARVEALRASVSAAREVPGDEMSGLLRRRYEVLLRRAESDHADGAAGADQHEGQGFDIGTNVVRNATAAARRRLLALRADGTIGDAAFQRVEQELDREELNFEPLARDEAAGRAPT
jgi:NhaP-type Na+/H+ or K+/H+ antiporter